ncbi:MAG TPA: cysteine hydrolase [Candidatus Koribacter sp.]
MTKADSEDLHGNVPDASGAALLLVDVINDFEFPQNENLLREAPRLQKALRRLKEHCRRAGIPTIYVNDNHGKWRSDYNAVVRWATRVDSPGRAFVQALTPELDDYIVLKPKHSAFFGTPLQAILEHLGAKSLIVAGVTANACVLLSVGDAYVQGYRILVPQDCVAALTPEAHDEALHLMEQSFGADTRAANGLDFEELSGTKKAA